MSELLPLHAGIYRHYKGPLYQVLGYGHDSNDEGRTVVVYIGLQLDGTKTGPRLAVRTAGDFFAVVDPTTGEATRLISPRPSYPRRFTYIGSDWHPSAGAAPEETPDAADGFCSCLDVPMADCGIGAHRWQALARRHMAEEREGEARYWQRATGAAPEAAAYVEAPTEYAGPGPAVFLAGGITDCPDWQAQARALLSHLPLVTLNPRRTDFPIHDPAAAPAQIAWEYRHLHRADVVLFWFPASTSAQPIALYELGAHAATGKPIAVGADPAYLRRADVVLQLGHVRPELRVYDSLADVCAEAARLVGAGAAPEPAGGERDG